MTDRDFVKIKDTYFRRIFVPIIISLIFLIAVVFIMFYSPPGNTGNWGYAPTQSVFF
jgi:hypothetical protein